MLAPASLNSPHGSFPVGSNRHQSHQSISPGPRIAQPDDCLDRGSVRIWCRWDEPCAESVSLEAKARGRCGLGDACWADHHEIYGFRPMPPSVVSTGGPSNGLSSGRHRDTATRPGSTRSSPSKNPAIDRKSTRLNSSHDQISYAVFCLKKKKKKYKTYTNNNKKKNITNKEQ